MLFTEQRLVQHVSFRYKTQTISNAFGWETPKSRVDEGMTENTQERIEEEEKVKMTPPR